MGNGNYAVVYVTWVEHADFLTEPVNISGFASCLGIFGRLVGWHGEVAEELELRLRHNQLPIRTQVGSAVKDAVAVL